MSSLLDEGRFPAGEFSVWQDFSNGTREQVRLRVSPEAAIEAFKHYTDCIGSRLGMTERVIIVDGDDYVNMEWKHGEGIVFPPELKGK